MFVCSHVQDSVNAEYVNYWLLRYDLHKNILECFEIGVGFDKKKFHEKLLRSCLQDVIHAEDLVFQSRDTLQRSRVSGLYPCKDLICLTV